jgi:hypothetical protein
MLGQDPLGDLVEGTRHTGAALSRGQQGAVGSARGGVESAAWTGRPLRGQRGVEQPAEAEGVAALRVGLGVVGSAVAGERCLRRESDDLHRSGVGDDDAVGIDPLVGQLLVVCAGECLGDLTDQESGLLWREGAVGEQGAEASAGHPLTDDVGHTVVAKRVEDANEADVGGRGGSTGRLEQLVGTWVVGREHVDDHRARKNLVDRTPGLSHPTVAGCLRE